MLKFEYYYLENKNARVKPNTLFVQESLQPRKLVQKTFTTNWGSLGFILNPDNHWITFTIYPNRISTFYKQVEEDDSVEAWPSGLAWHDWHVSADTLAPLTQKITYYQKNLPKISPVSFTFTTHDQV